MLYYKICRVFFKLFLRLMGKMTFIGTENIPKTGGVIIAPNHISYIDPPLISAGVSRQVHFMAKEELFKIPILGFVMRKAGSFPVRRGRADRKSLKHAIKILEENKVICIFLEGMRSPDGTLQKPEPGLGMIALKTRATIIPTAIIDADKVLPLHAKRLHFHPMKVIFGKPVPISDLYDADSSRQAIEEVGRRTMAEIADLLSKYSN